MTTVLVTGTPPRDSRSSCPSRARGSDRRSLPRDRIKVERAAAGHRAPDRHDDEHPWPVRWSPPSDGPANDPRWTADPALGRVVSCPGRPPGRSVDCGRSETCGEGCGPKLTADRLLKHGLKRERSPSIEGDLQACWARKAGNRNVRLPIEHAEHVW